VSSWDQLSGETARVFQAFVVYRELGPRRSLRDAAQKFYYPKEPDHPASRTQVARFQEWSAKHEWVRRCNEYDTYLAQAATQARLDEIENMNARQSSIGVQLQYRGFEKLQGVDLSSLSPTEALRWVLEGARIERLARGEATRRDEIAGTKGGAPISVSVDQVMAKLGRLTLDEDDADDLSDDE